MKKIVLLAAFCIALSSCVGTKSTEQLLENPTFSTAQTLSPSLEVKKLYKGKIPLQESEYRNFVDNSTSKFSIVIIPDTQGYVEYSTYKPFNNDYPFSNADILQRQIEFIKNNSVQNGGDFSFAIHVGDVVNWPIAYKNEWKLAVSYLTPLIDQIPYIIVPGNHDFNWWNNNYVSNLSQYNHNFGPKTKFFKNKEFLGGYNPFGNDLWCTFEACGIQFIVIGLEFEPSDSSLAWAQKVIDEHPGYPVIIATHGYLSTSKDAQTGQTNYTDHKYRKNKKFNMGEAIWKKLISKNDSIFLVVCGHSFNKNNGEGLRKDKNENGYTTYAILSNYQGRKDVLKYYGYNDFTCQYCGDGWLRTLDFDLEAKTIHARTYSTEFKAFEIDEDSDFYLPIDWDWDERFPACRNKIER